MVNTIGEEMTGRNSTVIGIRVSKAVNTILMEMAEKKGMTVSAFIKSKVEEYVRLANEPVDKPTEYVVIGGQRLRKPA